MKGELAGAFGKLISNLWKVRVCVCVCVCVRVHVRVRVCWVEDWAVLFCVGLMLGWCWFENRVGLVASARLQLFRGLRTKQLQDH